MPGVYRGRQDRRRLRDLFDFCYIWEAYTPAAKRQVGPYGMPVLVNGRLVAEMDARRDAEGVLRWRLLERTRVQTSGRRRIERAAATLARDLGTEAVRLRWSRKARRAARNQGPGRNLVTARMSSGGRVIPARALVRTGGDAAGPAAKPAAKPQ